MKSSFHRLIPFLPLFCNCQLNSIPLLPTYYPGRLASRNSTHFTSLNGLKSQSHIATDGQSVSKPWCPAPSVTHDQIFSYYYLTVTVLFLWGALSEERTGLSIVYAAGSSQRSLSRVRVPWYSRPYFTVSDLRLPFSSPLTTRRITVEVFGPASIRERPEINSCL
jgi:hypothetical protein